MVLNVSFGGGSDRNGVFFFRAADDALVNLSNYEASGKLIFDLNLPQSTITVGMQYKVDGGGSSTGDQTLDITSCTANMWCTLEIDVSTLDTLGLDITEVRTGVVLYPTLNNQQNLSFQVANVRYDDGSRLPLATTPLKVFDDGTVGSDWPRGLSAFDQADGYAECPDTTSSMGGAGCTSIGWELVTDQEANRGMVLEVTHTGSTQQHAGLIFSFATDAGRNMSGYRNGAITFDIKIVNKGTNTTGFQAKADCIWPCTSGDQDIMLDIDSTAWQSFTLEVADLVAGDNVLDLTKVNTGLVIFPKAGGTDGVVWRVDNVHWQPTVPQ